MRQQQRTENAGSRATRRRAVQTAVGLVVAAAILSGLFFLARTGASVQFPDMHGMGFSADGRQLVVAVHDGVRLFEDGMWRDPRDIPRNDYMGYSPVDEGFYSSGHPGPSVRRVNPLGLVKSTDGGRTLTVLGFEGESDFHVMAVGYESHAIYVLNPRPNSRLPAGLHYSLNDGETWEQSAAQGLAGNIIQIGVHPTDGNMVAVAAEGGLFVSSDYGDTFQRIGESTPVSAVTFDPGGSWLYFGYTGQNRYDLGSGEIETLQIPDISGDAIGYIAVNPATGEIVLATFGKDIYLSQDNGLSWEQIAERGVGRN